MLLLVIGRVGCVLLLVIELAVCEVSVCYYL